MLKRFGYALLLTVAVLSLVEVGLRLYGSDPNDHSTLFSSLISNNGIIDHPLYGTISRPGASVEREEYGKRFIYRENEWGLRGPRMALEKAPGTYRIIFVGASVVENSYLPEDEMFAFLVERKLNERLGGKPHVEVGVMAKPGATSETALAQIANTVLELQPDLVVQMSGGDWAKSVNPDYEPTLMYMGYPLHSNRTLLENIERAVMHSRTVQLLQRQFEGKPLKLTELRHSQPFKDPPDALFERGLKRYRENLHRSGILSQDAGAAFALMTKVWLYKADQPAKEDDALFRTYTNRDIRKGGWNVSPPVARKWTDRYNDVVRDVANTDNFLLIDLAKSVPNNLDNLLDDVHLTPAGNSAVADAIASQLLRGGTLPEPAVPRQQDTVARATGPGTFN